MAGLEVVVLVRWAYVSGRAMLGVFCGFVSGFVVAFQLFSALVV